MHLLCAAKYILAWLTLRSSGQLYYYKSTFMMSIILLSLLTSFSSSCLPWSNLELCYRLLVSLIVSGKFGTSAQVLFSKSLFEV